jgi:hypothetical protein
MNCNYQIITNNCIKLHLSVKKMEDSIIYRISGNITTGILFEYLHM